MVTTFLFHWEWGEKLKISISKTNKSILKKLGFENDDCTYLHPATHLNND